ncbi:flagellar export chaperone FlgN [Morganella morganii subsp. morganii]|mgnify:CR=1 FL=1|uniref:Flagellar biosynthesis protein FlgN n=1 Tax=Morganella morganii TaxID=582 RepID=A0A8I0PYN5_MORMO|nr:flagellar export chaperone FlgN [Morganella morganii]ELJ5777066.1 flagellar export chaperone FlgN [Morganella morganii]EMB6212541.1 flagellar export chaperone FlgN [Morganella morganii]MBA5820904.1 flagellar biosynthesis protein FlgN [Morganella morganii]MBE8611330.1 flagellar biosynthesis protein FlgN [Morganella morganii]MBT0512330.1 flagellar export chaperone FlgN [Morganella morganii subsp. morganii]
MTDQLLPLLDQQLSHLQSLHQVMKNEELLLGYPRVPQSPFQEATEQKRFLVAAIGHNETRRQALEQEAGLCAPYDNNETMHTVWNAIKDLTLTLKEMNYRNHQMLKLHMQFNQERLDFMKKHNNQATYGADGQESRTPVLGKKISV